MPKNQSVAYLCTLGVNMPLITKFELRRKVTRANRKMSLKVEEEEESERKNKEYQELTEKISNAVKKQYL